MFVSDKGQVTIPKHLRTATGILPGSEVSFGLVGSKIVISPVASAVKTDRRDQLRAAAAKLRKTMSPEFRELAADDIMAFLRGDDSPKAGARRGRR